ncbi:hypothetical protein JCM3775_003623 [Rhodotorula graminis]|uniref:Uncharacterized protein n=1 Tax=Rhodotorula graminis (strain WP1) TaxID=578459 RepID=A0A194S1Q7_RHOGW|nr:uncharacterized protein RHOBADRAFT_44934 [Rhodotorula graminis WP1]KPV74444.1 hypothetical protein RHOBADRAFT_44934 [Rhodotorula graminis WP1]
MLDFMPVAHYASLGAVLGVATALSLLVVLLEPRLGLLAKLHGFPDTLKTSLPTRLSTLVDDAVNRLGFPARARGPSALADPDPLANLALRSATTRDHLYVNKCLRWPYFQTMAHQAMHVNHWIEIDARYEAEMQYKASVVQRYRDETVISLPENDEGAGELLETLVDYLPKRYPTLFAPLPNGGIHNKVLGERHYDLKGMTGTDALVVVSKLVQDDFLMGREREDGHVYFVGGIVAVPGFYSFKDKVGKSMREVHEPVPQFNDKILMSVERTLKRFKPEEPFERSSWEIVDDLKAHKHNIATLEGDDKLADDLPPSEYIFRIDHQTFRKLPKSRAVVFGVHPILRPLHEFADLPLVPALLATVHKRGPSDLMQYKLNFRYQDKLLPYLKELTQSQIDRGLITGDEDVAEFRALLGKVKA